VRKILKEGNDEDFSFYLSSWLLMQAKANEKTFITLVLIEKH